MDRETIARLLTIRFPSLAEMEAKRKAANESYDSDVPPEEQRHMSDQRRRLLNIRPAGEDTIHWCWLCDRRFHLPSRLIAHQIYQHDFDGEPRPIKVPCPICYRLCRNEFIMGLHLGTHIGERRCFKCGAEFASATSAHAHKRLHHNRGNFQCRFCRKLFALKSKRDDHCRLEHLRQLKRQRSATSF
ncbi:uncharacterized protein LOC144103852 [Amblyomma americanum]